eukprot:g73836.t1
MDLFFVKYSAQKGAQRDLGIHVDGSPLSFNLLLNLPVEFEGGGTYFEATGEVVTNTQGSVLCHSGLARHGGWAINSGERYLLVGFLHISFEVLVNVQLWHAHPICHRLLSSVGLGHCVDDVL